MTDTASATSRDRSSVSRRLMPAETVRPVSSQFPPASGLRLTVASSELVSSFIRRTAERAPPSDRRSANRLPRHCRREAFRPDRGSRSRPADRLPPPPRSLPWSGRGARRSDRPGQGSRTVRHLPAQRRDNLVPRLEMDETDDQQVGSERQKPREQGDAQLRRHLSAVLRFEHVAGAANRMQQRPFEPVLELAPEPADMDVDDVGRGVEVIVPHLLRSIVRVTTRPSLRAKYSRSRYSRGFNSIFLPPRFTVRDNRSISRSPTARRGSLVTRASLRRSSALARASNSANEKVSRDNRRSRIPVPRCGRRPSPARKG